MEPSTMADVVIEFENLNKDKMWWRRNGIGWGCVVASDRERDRKNPGLVGEVVRIDGETFEVVAIEMHMPATPIREGEEIGLFVKEHIQN
jgi:hypothetical protein